jgi:hypothetical protein
MSSVILGLHRTLENEFLYDGVSVAVASPNGVIVTGRFCAASPTLYSCPVMCHVVPIRDPDRVRLYNRGWMTYGGAAGVGMYRGTKANEDPTVRSISGPSVTVASLPVGRARVTLCSRWSKTVAFDSDVAKKTPDVWVRERLGPVPQSMYAYEDIIVAFPRSFTST